MQEILVGSLGQEDPPEKETAIHSSVLAWTIPWTEEPGGCRLWSSKELDTTEQQTLPLHKNQTTWCGWSAGSPVSLLHPFSRNAERNSHHQEDSEAARSSLRQNNQLTRVLLGPYLRLITQQSVLTLAETDKEGSARKQSHLWRGLHSPGKETLRLFAGGSRIQPRESSLRSLTTECNG